MIPNPEERACFCEVCGTGLEWRELFGRRRKACTSCGFIYFPAVATAVGAIVARGREVLLVRRAVEPGRGKWSFPAGFQDYDETPAEAAVREVVEETGLEIRLSSVFDVRLTDTNPRKLLNLIVYLAQPVAGELRAADDAMEARFFSLERLPEDLAFDNNLEILDRLRRENPTGDIF